LKAASLFVRFSNNANFVANAVTDDVSEAFWEDSLSR
jgi:hypothetical protein